MVYKSYKTIFQAPEGLYSFPISAVEEKETDTIQNSSSKSSESIDLENKEASYTLSPDSNSKYAQQDNLIIKEVENSNLDSEDENLVLATENDQSKTSEQLNNSTNEQSENISLISKNEQNSLSHNGKQSPKIAIDQTDSSIVKEPTELENVCIENQENISVQNDNENLLSPLRNYSPIKEDINEHDPVMLADKIISPLTKETDTGDENDTTSAKEKNIVEFSTPSKRITRSSCIMTPTICHLRPRTPCSRSTRRSMLAHCDHLSLDTLIYSAKKKRVSSTPRRSKRLSTIANNETSDANLSKIENVIEQNENNKNQLSNQSSSNMNELESLLLSPEFKTPGELFFKLYLTD